MQPLRPISLLNALLLLTLLASGSACSFYHPVVGVIPGAESSEDDATLTLLGLAGAASALSSGDQVQLSNTAGVTDETGGQHAVDVTLRDAPAGGPVELSVTSSNPAEGTVSPATLSFDSANFATPQTITITGQNDATLDLRASYTVTITVGGTATNYTAGETFTVAMSNVTAAKHMFVSSTETAGDMSGNGQGVNGVTGDDLICQLDAHKPNTGATYKAFLVDGTNRVVLRTTSSACGTLFSMTTTSIRLVRFSSGGCCVPFLILGFGRGCRAHRHAIQHERGRLRRGIGASVLGHYELSRALRGAVAASR